ncbi:glycosyltransferase family 2 protein [Mycoplasma sp. P36-A1]|uniref:glycosyltransferase family 2 protein n=1 Tax=Mycoplasma sp. P36-A1 TaxID=3252900 RepID=UPI003C2D98E0
MLSIIIPAYNSEKFVLRALNSIADQTFIDYEIIIINDGSTDNTLKLITKFKEKHANIDMTIFDIINQGHGAARNLGIEHAKHEYIWFVDADDFIYNKYSFEKAALDLNKYKPDLYIFSVFETNFGKRKKVWNFAKKDKLTTIKESPYLYLSQSWSWNKPVKRSLLIDNNIRFNSELMFEDIYLFSEIYPKTKSIYISTDIKYVYVKHEDSLTGSLKNFKKYPQALTHASISMVKTIFKK